MEIDHRSDEQAVKDELEAEMQKLFEHLERDEESAAKLAKALEPESTAAALHFALFPCRTRDGGLRPTCKEPVVSMMAFVVDLFSPHDGSVDLLVLAECFHPTENEDIVGLSYQYKDESGNTVIISRGKVKDAKRQFAHQVQLRLSLPSNPNISVKVFKTGRLQIAGSKDEPTCKIIIHNVLAALNSIQQTPAGASVFERHVCEPSGQHVPITGPLEYEQVVKPETVNINCTFDAGTKTRASVFLCEYTYTIYLLFYYKSTNNDAALSDEPSVFLKKGSFSHARNLWVAELELNLLTTWTSVAALAKPR